MSDLDKLRTGQDARQAHAARTDATRYSGAINRYLGVLGYRPVEPALPAPSRVPPGVVAKTGLVLVGVDDSPISCTALDHAAIEAELRGWDLRMLHVQGARQPAQDAGARLLERLTERVRACAPSVAVTSRLVTGSAASRLLVEGRHAGLVVVGHRHGAAALVVGRHGPGGMPAGLLGSVSRAVVQHAHCPVFLVG